MINEKTLVPISLVITIIGGVIWLTTVWARVETHTSEISDLKSEQRSLSLEVRDNNRLVMQKLIELQIKLERK